MMTEQVKEKEYTVKEVKVIFDRKSVVTIRRWIDEGKLPGSYFDGWKWKIPQSAIDERKKKLKSTAQCSTVGDSTA